MTPVPGADPPVDRFGLHLAVAARQVYDWNQDFILSHRDMTVALDVIPRAIQSSNEVT